jgi:hypothetical protein
MSRIIIIGDSHVGAYKSGFNSLDTADNKREVLFLAAPFPLYQKFQKIEPNLIGFPDDGVLPKGHINLIYSINNLARIEVRDDDKLVFIGGHQVFDDIVAFMNLWSIDEVRSIPAQNIMSNQLFRLMVEDFATSSAKGSIWKKFIDRCDYYILPPLVSEGCLAYQADVDGYEKWRAASTEAAGMKAVLEAYVARYEIALKQYDIKLIRQAEETLSEIGLTLGKFSKGSTNLKDLLHEEVDHTHMNDEYGRVMLEKLFSVVEQTG